MIYHNELMFSH